jgi:hypothetical protein
MSSSIFFNFLLFVLLLFLVSTDIHFFQFVMNAPIPMIPHEYNFWAMNEKQGMLQQCMEASILKFLSKDCLSKLAAKRNPHPF